MQCALMRRCWCDQWRHRVETDRTASIRREVTIIEAIKVRTCQGSKVSFTLEATLTFEHPRSTQDTFFKLSY